MEDLNYYGNSTSGLDGGADIDPDDMPMQIDDAEGMQEIIRELLCDAVMTGVYGELNRARVRTYEDAGILTRDSGIVIRLANGREFQVTIVQSA